MEDFLRGILGMAVLLGICYLLSNNRKAVDWKFVGIGLFAQFMFAAGVLDIRLNDILPFLPSVSIFWPALLIIILIYMVRKFYLKEKSVVKWSVLFGLFALC